MNKVNTMIDNYINGNISTAKSQAKKLKREDIRNILMDDYFYDYQHANSIMEYLKYDGAYPIV